MRINRVVLVGCVLVLLAACRRAPSSTRSSAQRGASTEHEPDVMALASRFVRDAGFRRQTLEGSLVNQSNDYARSRLAKYGHEAWGSLPVARFRSRPVRPADLGKPAPTPDASWTASGGNDALPSDAEGLRQMGERLFKAYPAQIERSMFTVLRDQQGPSRYGLWQTSASVGGLVWVELPGGVYPALTCSSCHSSTTASGALRTGVPNHWLDIGRAKDDYAGTRSLYSTWGPGRLDIAEDGHDNPVVIGDLRAVQFQTHVHRTANVENSLPALAVRVETGLITAHRQEVRPTPVDAFALAYYLWRLADDLPSPGAASPAGAALFAARCAGCHQGPGLSGRPVAAEAIASPVAQMQSAARGTGTLQTTSLRGVSDRRLLLYGGQAAGLDALLSPERKSGGHYFGQDLLPAERRALVDYLGKL